MFFFPFFRRETECRNNKQYASVHGDSFRFPVGDKGKKWSEKKQVTAYGYCAGRVFMCPDVSNINLRKYIDDISMVSNDELSVGLEFGCFL